ncbi:Eco57I restriction-modification methylase domain-containing protein, partial [Phocaeicola plebeius]
MVSIINLYVLHNRPSKEGFDIVIGNPPYGAKYDNKTKRYYKNTYVTANS